MNSHHHHHHHDHDCAHDHDPISPAASIGGAGSLGEHHGAVDAICIDHVSHSYGPIESLRDVTLHVEQGSILGIVGPNGGGKSTLLKIMLGLIEDYRGSVTILGHSPREVCRRGDLVGYLPQRHEFEPRFPVSVRQVVTMGLAGKSGMTGRHRPEDLRRVEQVMEQAGVADLADRPIGELSGGQQQRAFIARALAAGPRVLLMDEPTVGVDPAGQQEFAALIRRLHAEHALTVVIVSHDLRTIAAGCQRVACLARTVHYHDAPGGLTSELLSEVFRHDIVPTHWR
jgi:zinc transport system ATP-binding protein